MIKLLRKYLKYFIDLWRHKNICLLVVLVTILNVGLLYYHQCNANIWLPRESEYKWRYASIRFMIISEKNKLSFEHYDGIDYTDLEEDKKVIIDDLVRIKYPDDLIISLRNKNDMLAYINNFGMWQFPLAMTSLFLCLSGIIKYKKYLFYVPLSLLSFLMPIIDRISAL